MFELKQNRYQKKLEVMPYVQSAVFFDLSENSMMDILLVQQEPGKASFLSAIYNNYSKDQFYLKARMLSDAELGH